VQLGLRRRLGTGGAEVSNAIQVENEPWIRDGIKIGLSFR
jgi:hypothetical protein